MSELRKHPRKSVRTEFVCRDESGQGELVFDSGDLSAGGAFLLSQVLFEQGERLKLELGLPGRTVCCEAYVAWVRRFPGPGEEAGMGVQFVWLADADRHALEEFVAKLRLEPTR